MSEQMFVLDAAGVTHEESLTVKKSRFVATLAAVDSETHFRTYLDTIRARNTAAHHACWAYSLGTGPQVARFSDDGEPTGTAGPPILAALQTRTVTNAAIVVVRYYGGVQLGTGGLVRAYGSVARAVLDHAAIRAAKLISRVRFSVPISDAGRIDQVVYSLGAVRSCEYASQSVSYVVEVVGADESVLCDRVLSITSGGGSILGVERMVA